MEKTFAQLAEFYQTRFGFLPPRIAESLRQETRIIITIPCHNELDLLGTLQSLKNCQPSVNPIEVIVGVNAGVNSSEEIHQQNLQTKKEFELWITGNETELLKFHLVYTDDLPKKHAGAGLARKIIMDEAFYRFSSNQTDGLIVCLDADCRVSPNYLLCLEEAEKRNSKSQ
ncbi:MAG: cellulose synthase/poly-beta-1,6-N-acetylglucosamine synthase-like glycosyltransferase, partial [Arenicella sp.]